MHNSAVNISITENRTIIHYVESNCNSRAQNFVCACAHFHKRLPGSVLDFVP